MSKLVAKNNSKKRLIDYIGLYRLKPTQNIWAINSR